MSNLTRYINALLYNGEQTEYPGGKITVTANYADGEWTVDNGSSWYGLGSAVEVPVGKYTIQYRDIEDSYYGPPAEVSQRILQNASVSISASYGVTKGKLLVSGIVHNRTSTYSGGQFSVNGGDLYACGYEIYVSSGNVSVSFGSVENKMTPSAMSADISAGVVNTLEAHYLQQGYAMFDSAGSCVSSAASASSTYDYYLYGSSNVSAVEVYNCSIGGIYLQSSNYGARKIAVLDGGYVRYIDATLLGENNTVDVEICSRGSIGELREERNASYRSYDIIYNNGTYTYTSIYSTDPRRFKSLNFSGGKIGCLQLIQENLTLSNALCDSVAVGQDYYVSCYNTNFEPEARYGYLVLTEERAGNSITVCGGSIGVVTAGHLTLTSGAYVGSFYGDYHYSQTHIWEEAYDPEDRRLVSYIDSSYYGNAFILNAGCTLGYAQGGTLNLCAGTIERAYFKNISLSGEATVNETSAVSANLRGSATIGKLYRNKYCSIGGDASVQDMITYSYNGQGPTVSNKVLVNKGGYVRMQGSIGQYLSVASGGTAFIASDLYSKMTISSAEGAVISRF